MPRIRVNTSRLSGYESDMQSILMRINAIMSQFDAVSRKLDWEIRAEEHIDSRLQKIGKELMAETNGISGMKNFLETARSKYYDVENKHIEKSVKYETIGHSTGAKDDSKTQSVKATAGWMNRNGISVAETVNTEPKITNGAPLTNKNSVQEIFIKYLKKVGKSGLDALGKAGTYGKMGALPIELLKNIIDGDGITGKDLGSIIKGMGNTFIGMCEEYDKTAGKWPLSTDDIKSLAGFKDAYKTISIESAKAGWLAKVENAGVSAWKTFKSQISPKVIDELPDGNKVFNGLDTGKKLAGWSLTLIANGFSNYDEYSKGEISGGRARAETVTETLVDIGKNAAVLAGVAAGCAAIGVAAPAAVVGGIGVGVSLIADVVCENITGNSVTETTSDFILDTASKVGTAISGAADKAKKAVSGWFDKLR